MPTVIFINSVRFPRTRLDFVASHVISCPHSEVHTRKYQWYRPI